MKRYSEIEVSFIRENYLRMSNQQLAESIGRTALSVSYRLQVLKLTRPRHNWTKEELKFLKSHASDLSHKEMATALSCSLQSVKAALKNYHVKSGRTGYFTKGHRPWNFRKKGIVTGGIQTQFKKGQDPKNTLYDGCITIRRDHVKERNGRPYKWIRLAKGKWELYHRWLWVQKNGPIPAGHIVTFKDGNSLNADYSNLQMITMAENARRNYNPAKAQIASKSLTDNYVAGRLANGDKQLRNALIQAGQELIKAKRNQLILKRTIKGYDRDKKAGANAR